MTREAYMQQLEAMETMADVKEALMHLTLLMEEVVELVGGQMLIWKEGKYDTHRG